MSQQLKNKSKQRCTRKAERGSTLTETTLLIALITLISIGSISSVGERVKFSMLFASAGFAALSGGTDILEEATVIVVTP